MVWLTGEDYCPNCGTTAEYQARCPNCDEELDDPDLCEICYWESGDPLNDSVPLPGRCPNCGEKLNHSDICDLCRWEPEDEIPEASHGATANHDQVLLDFLTMVLGTGKHAAITNLAVSYNDFAAEALRKQRRKVAALIRSHVKKLVDDGLLPPGHKVTIDWHYETGVPMAGLDPPYRTTHPRASQLHYQHEAAARAEKEREQAAAKAERQQAAAKAEKEKAAKKAAKVKRQKKRVERVGKKRGCLPIVIGVFSIFGVFSVILDACEGDENTAWPEGFDQRVAEVSFED